MYVVEAGRGSVCDVGRDDGGGGGGRFFRWRLDLPVLEVDLAVAGRRDVEDSAIVVIHRCYVCGLKMTGETFVDFSCTRV
jgi:hypothetical protein